MSRRPHVILDETRAAQARAADPSASAWVSAHAGSGKTHVLANRVIRLLLDGTDPSRILCLTYTRAAAGEMKAIFGDRYYLDRHRAQHVTRIHKVSRHNRLDPLAREQPP